MNVTKMNFIISKLLGVEYYYLIVEYFLAGQMIAVFKRKY